MRLAGKVAVITGGGNGMGRATALLFAREGAAVVIGDVDRAGGASAVAAIESAGGRAAFQPTDVSREAEVAALIALAESRFGRLDTNLKGTFFGCKHAIPALLRGGGGTIVNNASVSAYANVGGNVSYAASKGAVMSLTRVLAIEHARDNIRVNAICPGVIDTPMNERNLERSADKEATRERWRQVTPMGRMGTGAEIAETVLYLASPQSSFTTGIGLLIDGGRVAT
jgi:NAD(P)-dependent dehydrogenase (short-subunit alcohol dehydrogenase family)